MNKTITFSSNLTGVLVQRAIELAYEAGGRDERNGGWDEKFGGQDPRYLDGVVISDSRRDEIMSKLHAYLPEAERIAKEKAE